MNGSGVLEEMKQGTKPFEVKIRMVSFVRYRNGASQLDVIQSTSEHGEGTR